MLTAVGQVFNLSKRKRKCTLGKSSLTSVSLSETDIRVSERLGYVHQDRLKTCPTHISTIMVLAEGRSNSTFGSYTRTTATATARKKA